MPARHGERRGAGLLALALVGAGAAAPSGCGGGGDGPGCGNGRLDPGEMCDDGNTADGDGCSYRCQTGYNATIRWTVIKNEFPGFNETCAGVGADEIELAMAGPRPDTLRVDCQYGQTTISELPPGDYTLGATLHEVDPLAMPPVDRPVSSGMTMAAFTIADRSETIDLDFAFADFPGSYTGTFWFRLKWGGATTCTGAAPPVAEQALRLERGGVPLTGLDEMNMPVTLDGATPAACRPFDDQFAQKVNGVAWGPAQITVTGLDGAGLAQFRRTFDTFVGAGAANPELVFDVNSLAPDAMPPDASPPDAAPVADAPAADAM